MRSSAFERTLNICVSNRIVSYIIVGHFLSSRVSRLNRMLIAWISKMRYVTRDTGVKNLQQSKTAQPVWGSGHSGVLSLCGNTVSGWRLAHCSQMYLLYVKWLVPVAHQRRLEQCDMKCTTWLHLIVTNGCHLFTFITLASVCRHSRD